MSSGVAVGRMAVVPALLLAVWAGAGPPASVVATLSALEIVPAEIVVGSDGRGTEIELEARMWVGTPTERWSAKRPGDYNQIVWTENQTWITSVGSPDVRATFAVAPNAVAGTSATIRVDAGGLFATAKVTVVTAPAANEDVILAGHTNDVTAAAIVNGVPAAAPGNCATIVSAFARRAFFEDLASQCGGKKSGWEAVVFDTGRRAAFVPVAWQAGTTRVDAEPHQAGRIEVPFALRIMSYPPQTAAATTSATPSPLSVALGEIAKANDDLADARAGFKFVEHDVRVIPVSAPVAFGSCAEGDHLTSTYDVPHVLQVYYVDDLNIAKGLTCPAHARRPYDVIYISLSGHSATSLVHELGHALGLTLPGDGHTESMGGFDATNVMTSGDDDHDPAGRHRLTLGQVFRMNADSASWLNRGRDLQGNPLRPPGSPVLDCQCTVLGQPLRCPALQADLGTSSKAVPTVDEWACYDQIQFTKMEETDPDKPVVLLSGRGWRADPATCVPSVWSGSEAHEGSVYGWFENLTNPGDCHSWAVAFFGRHRPLYLKPGDGKLSPYSDLLVDWTEPPAPPVISVKTYYPAVAAGDVEQDRIYAAQIFGEANRAGLDLAFELYQDVGCPPPASTPVHIVILCYEQVQGDEATADGRRIRVRTLSRKSTTMPHFLGLALGLGELTAADPGSAGNIMRDDYDQRGDKLTLGQVFRLHVPLSAALPKCDPGPCPSLEADEP